MISTKADTREAAGQMAMGTILPSIFLSGYVFPLDSMPRSSSAIVERDPDDLADRRGPRGDPARRRLAGVVAARGGAVGDGRGDADGGFVEVAKATGVAPPRT